MDFDLAAKLRQESIACACVDGVGGKFDSNAEVEDKPGSDQHRGRVQQHDLSSWPEFAVEDASQNRGVRDCISAAETFKRRASQAEIFRSDRAELDVASSDFGYLAGSAD